MLRIFRFSKVSSFACFCKLYTFVQDFGDIIVFPLVALFFGTGNQTPYISSAILERVFMDPNMRLVRWTHDSFPFAEQMPEV
jgi:hypothetical protein